MVNTITNKKQEISQIIVVSILVSICFYGIYYRWVNKIFDYTREDTITIYGTLKSQPYYEKIGKSGKELVIKLNEYKNKSFTAFGIYLSALNADKVISENNANDSIQISVLRDELQKTDTLHIIELRNSRVIYLTLTDLNNTLVMEILLQAIVIYPLTIVLIIVLIRKLILLRRRSIV